MELLILHHPKHMRVPHLLVEEGHPAGLDCADDGTVRDGIVPSGEDFTGFDPAWRKWIFRQRVPGVPPLI
jgi:hypothetical protein